ncbi:hypothetical protein ABE237_05525 [Brevibacillus formosus]|uniref:hypothetical protein n=1 Tax=Brevibacillus formosus TaxID=54913 RepID=UPI0018CC9C31|nr:hypothetical protein [Brevibacillus formosus]MBG9941414.1 hypothetical protein [Brevibacillus formosus]MED1948828.1 hypothetical protein [Brevibacillus formosus]MED2001351.1 hypothetical protein [Brevibacillus formosus]MED2085435.1 hypothetical protein [Brevibacillus formosus]
MQEEKINYGSELCMQFSNEELYKYLITKFDTNRDVIIKTLSEDDQEVEITSNIPIQFICFDGDKQDLFISFNGNQTSIFVKDEELMFIDESTKGSYTTSDTFGNVVYEGTFRNITHEEMLTLFAEIITCFIGAIEVEIIEKEVPSDKQYKKYDYYKSHSYEINVKNNNLDRKKKVFENITINY